MKLPRQWKHWAQKNGLKPESKHSDYLVGRNRRWRVNCLGEFQCSCLLSDFDRWANSVGATLGYIPSTEAQFSEAVYILRHSSLV